MKIISQKLVLIILIISSTASLAQTIRRVNNTGITGTNIYTTLQAAHNAASDGDIIYIDGSNKTYGNDATITKKLTIIGPGYLLAENYPSLTDLKPADLNAKTIIFDAGSSGSSIMGCQNFFVRVNASNVTITRNNGLTIYPAYNADITLTGILVSKNFQVRINNGSGYAGMIISNNYLNDLSLNAKYSGTANNNVIYNYGYGINTTTTYTLVLTNFSLSNNILLRSNTPEFTNCSLNNNIDATPLGSNLNNNSFFGNANGNKGNVDNAELFVGGAVGPVNNPNTVDWKLKLKTGSVAIGAGTGGTDCGIYGGGNPYELSGISSADYPAIIKLTTSGTGSSTTPLSVTISTKSN
jgi:hypothetical protein